jgi:hypothetical protein
VLVRFIGGCIQFLSVRDKGWEGPRHVFLSGLQAAFTSNTPAPVIVVHRKHRQPAGSRRGQATRPVGAARSTAAGHVDEVTTDPQRGRPAQDAQTGTGWEELISEITEPNLRP